MSAFRDVQSKFADKNAQVLGVSMDDLDTQKRFAQSLDLPFPLAADPKGTTAEAYGVRNGDHPDRSEEHTSELQSRPHLVCRLLLEKKKKKKSFKEMSTKILSKIVGS